MTDLKKHPLYSHLVELYLAVQGDIQTSVTVASGKMALNCLKFEEAITDKGLSVDNWYSCNEILNEMKSCVLAMTDDCSPQASVLKSLADGIQEAVEVVLRADARCDCHNLSDKEVRQKVWDLTGGRCTYCDCQLENGGTVGASFIVEHVVPRSMGGPDNLANYVPSCASCNSSKGDRHVLQFIQTKMDRRRPPLTVVPLPAAASE